MPSIPIASCPRIWYFRLELSRQTRRMSSGGPDPRRVERQLQIPAGTFERGDACQPSLESRKPAVAYWRARRRHGERLRVVAAALGVTHWSLHRWMRAPKRHGRFHPVQIVPSVRTAPTPPLVIELPSIGARVAGLDVETAAQLLTRLQ